MQSSKAKAGIAALLSAGWVIPLYYAAYAYAAYWTREMVPALKGAPIHDSFPHLLFATNLVQFALGWLGLVILVWAYVACSRRAA
jgi:hypothetical protein